LDDSCPWLPLTKSKSQLKICNNYFILKTCEVFARKVSSPPPPPKPTLLKETPFIFRLCLVLSAEQILIGQRARRTNELGKMEIGKQLAATICTIQKKDK
jgi:hypothetical protein